MTDTFLSPAGDYGTVASFCGVKTDWAANIDFQLAVDAAAEEVRAKCGPVLIESGLTFTSRAASYALVLPFRVAALESITDASGSALTLADFYVESHPLGAHGGQVVRRVDGGVIPACTVAYSSGWAHLTYPAKLVAAGKEIARHLWRTRLGNQRAGDEQGGAWLWPKQAEALAADWMLTPMGFA